MYFWGQFVPLTFTAFLMKLLFFNIFKILIKTHESEIHRVQEIHLNIKVYNVPLFTLLVTKHAKTLSRIPLWRPVTRRSRPGFIVSFGKTYLMESLKLCHRNNRPLPSPQKRSSAYFQFHTVSFLFNFNFSSLPSKFSSCPFKFPFFSSPFSPFPCLSFPFFHFSLPFSFPLFSFLQIFPQTFQRWATRPPCPPLVTHSM